MRIFQGAQAGNALRHSGPDRVKIAEAATTGAVLVVRVPRLLSAFQRRLEVVETESHKRRAHRQQAN
jgi:hypothetical protein